MSLTTRNVKQLAQSRISDTNTASVYSPGTGILTHLTRIMVTNNTGSNVVGILYLDEDGTTYTEATEIWHGSVTAYTTTTIMESKSEFGGIPMRNSSGNLAFNTATGNALTLTVYGEEVGKEIYA